jgi:hypothetical protein
LVRGQCGSVQRGIALTEQQFQRAVLQTARLFGWRTAHFRPARTAAGTWRTPVEGDGKGFPDLVLLRRDQILVRELKVGSGKLSREQADWLQSFRDADVDAWVWRPEDWDQIEEELR